MLIRPGLRVILLACVGVLAVVAALHLVAGRPDSGVAITAESAPSSPTPHSAGATTRQSAPISQSPGAGIPNPLPNLGQRINDETGAVARGQMSILDELERAIADQVRAIIRHAQGH